MNKINYYFLISMGFLFLGSFHVNAATMVDAYELIYEEKEAGTDVYQVKFTISERYLRIDQLGDPSGYVVYDDKKHVIHSVAHQDESVLVIPQYSYEKSDLLKLVDVAYDPVPDAPKISGKGIHTYRVTSSNNTKQKCTDIQLAEGLLPEVTRILAAYQKMIAGQQSRLLKTTPKEYQDGCFLSDQIFNEGDYYLKGLPIQEWHSNDKSRLLVSYKKVKVDPEIFQSNEPYEKYSLE